MPQCTSGYIGDRAPLAPGISANGRYVVFESEASNLLLGDMNGVADIFVHDLQTETTERVSVSSDGAEANGSSANPFISADGRYVVFESSASNLVSDNVIGSPNVFIRDRLAGETTLVSFASDGTPGNSDSGWPSISASGRFIAFHSYASNLVTGDGNGAQDIFVHDNESGQTFRVSVSSNGSEANANSREPMISDDGQWIVFGSDASNLVTGDSNGVQDVFLHDRVTGETARVSVATSGLQANDLCNVPAISGDGRYITFQSPASSLVSGDTNSWDAFIHDRVNHETIRVSINSLGAEGNSFSWNISISADGGVAVFTSFASNLVV